MALGTGHPRRHSRENDPSAWIRIHGRGAWVTPGSSLYHPCCKHVTLEARLTTRMPGSLFTSWRIQECLPSQGAGGKPVIIAKASTFKLSLCAFPGDVRRLYSSTKNSNILFIKLAETQRQSTLFGKANV